ncbi:MAG: MOSC domain-containing protein [Chloroflexi bacterium]|nr:MOSC domain-containing protein [Chloroflexota bacterium]
MPTVQAINIAPVKSLGLLHPQTVSVGETGVIGDRRFCVEDELGKMLTQRQVGKMVQVRAQYHRKPESLRLVFPDGRVVEGTPVLGKPTQIKIGSREVPGRAVEGDWSAALSDYCGRPARLVQVNASHHYQDLYPVSLLSQASVDELSRRSNGQTRFDARRFRPTFLLEGCRPHEEDSWEGRTVRIGEQLRLRIAARDPRCVITRLNPDTGERDADTLSLILDYRPDPTGIYFGVYATVEQPGLVSIGDEITLV